MTLFSEGDLITKFSLLCAILDGSRTTAAQEPDNGKEENRKGPQGD
jgi:hypothetical protein